MGQTESSEPAILDEVVDEFHRINQEIDNQEGPVDSHSKDSNDINDNDRNELNELRAISAKDSHLESQFDLSFLQGTSDEEEEVSSTSEELVVRGKWSPKGEWIEELVPAPVHGSVNSFSSSDEDDMEVVAHKRNSTSTHSSHSYHSSTKSRMNRDITTNNRNTTINSRDDSNNHVNQKRHSRVDVHFDQEGGSYKFSDDDDDDDDFRHRSSVLDSQNRNFLKFYLRSEKLDMLGEIQEDKEEDDSDEGDQDAAVTRARTGNRVSSRMGQAEEGDTKTITRVRTNTTAVTLIDATKVNTIWYFDPESTSGVIWLGLCILCSLYLCWMIPYRLAFGFTENDYDLSSLPPVSIIFDGLVDIFFWVDLFVQFRTPFLRRGLMEHKLNVIASHYIHSPWFWLDLGANLPVDAYQFVEMEYLPWTRFNKLLRLFRLIQYVHLAQRHPSINSYFVSVSKLPILLFYISHCFGCFYWWYAEENDHQAGSNSNNWLPVDEVYLKSAQFRYFYSVYWAFGIMTGRVTGSTPQDAEKSIITAFIILAGTVFSSYIVGAISATVELSNRHFRQFQLKRSVTTRFMELQSFDPRVTNTVSNYFDYLWSRTKGFDLVQILASMPNVLSTDIKMYLLHDILDSLDLFYGVEPGFVRALVNHIDLEIFVPNEVICREGDPGTTMYFIHDGRVDVYKGSIYITTLERRGKFGEMGLVSGQPRTATVIAQGFCELFSLQGDHYHQVAKNFPHSGVTVQNKARELMHQQRQENAEMVRDHRRKKNATPLSGRRFSQSAKKFDILSKSSPVLESSLIALNNDHAGIEMAVLSDLEVSSFSDNEHETKQQTFTNVSDEEQQENISESNAVETSSTHTHYTYRRGPELWSIVRQFLHEGLLQSPEFKANKKSGRIGWDSLHLALMEMSALRKQKEHANRFRCCRRKLCHWNFAVLPEDTFRSVWDVILHLAIVYNALNIPYRCAFDRETESTSVLIADICVDLIYLVDIVLNFYIAAPAHGRLVTNQTSIQRQYVRFWLYWDIAALSPWEVFWRIAGGWNAFIRLPKLLKMANMYRRLAQVIKIRERPYDHLFRLFFSFLLVNHLIACFWYLFTDFEGFAEEYDLNEWLPSETLQYEGREYRYLRSFYFGLTMLTGFGYTDNPFSEYELVYSLLSVLLGVVVVAYLIGNVTNVINNLDHFGDQFQRQFDSFLQFMSYHKLPPDLQGRVRTYLKHKWGAQRGADPNEALQYIPETLRIKIKSTMFESTIHGSQLGQQRLSSACSADLISHLQVETYPPGECIYVTDTMSEKLYFVHSGTVDLVHGNAANALAPVFLIDTLAKGGMFGHSEMLQHIRRSHNAVSRTSTDLFALQEVKLRQLREQYPVLNRFFEVFEYSAEELGLSDTSKLSQETIQQHIKNHKRRVDDVKGIADTACFDHWWATIVQEARNFDQKKRPFNIERLRDLEEKVLVQYVEETMTGAEINRWRRNRKLLREPDPYSDHLMAQLKQNQRKELEDLKSSGADQETTALEIKLKRLAHSMSQQEAEISRLNDALAIRGKRIRDLDIQVQKYQDYDDTKARLEQLEEQAKYFRQIDQENKNLLRRNKNLLKRLGSARFNLAGRESAVKRFQGLLERSGDDAKNGAG